MAAALASVASEDNGVGPGAAPGRGSSGALIRWARRLLAEGIVVFAVTHQVMDAGGARARPHGTAAQVRALAPNTSRLHGRDLSHFPAI